MVKYEHRMKVRKVLGCSSVTINMKKVAFLICSMVYLDGVEGTFIYK